MAYFTMAYMYGFKMAYIRSLVIEWRIKTFENGVKFNQIYEWRINYAIFKSIRTPFANFP
jgi:hypothetical protein